MGTQMVYDYDELAALTKAAQDGDVRAYGRIVELTRNSVEAAARVIVHNPEDAEDIAQETYVRAFGQLGNLQDVASLLAWLQRIARNLALNRRRASRLTAVGLGVGLERLAMMLYGIDDIRRIGAERV